VVSIMALFSRGRRRCGKVPPQDDKNIEAEVRQQAPLALTFNLSQTATSNEKPGLSGGWQEAVTPNKARNFPIWRHKRIK